MKFDFTDKPQDPVELAEFAPVLLKEVAKHIREKAVIISSQSFLNQHSIILKDGEPQVPEWLENCMRDRKNVLIIENVDLLNEEDQQNFYELLKYNQLSSVKLPIKLKILLTYKNLKNINPTIASLCLIMK